VDFRSLGSLCPCWFLSDEQAAQVNQILAAAPSMTSDGIMR
jgi:hypothetical protein